MEYLRTSQLEDPPPPSYSDLFGESDRNIEQVHRVNRTAVGTTSVVTSQPQRQERGRNFENLSSRIAYRGNVREDRESCVDCCAKCCFETCIKAGVQACAYGCAALCCCVLQALCDG